ATTDFETWDAVLTNAPRVGSLEMVDATALNYRHRFYRAVELGWPPASPLQFEQPELVNTATGRVFRARLTGLSGLGAVTVFGSTNLSDWQPIHTNAPLAGDWQLELPLA
ncbi:MAG: hypothetical protein N3I86_08985, partial [Verrucomicrobiae bacterium]|nr:hypothetical protein [Verrucomicrobiae bacterium]